MQDSEGNRKKWGFLERLKEFYIPYTVYPFYNWCAIHNFPTFVLDLLAWFL